MGKIKDLSGKVFGRLTVIDIAHKNKWGNYFWNCSCSCGNTKTVVGGNLCTGTTMSCGCYQYELQVSGSITHGMTNTPEFLCWQDIIKRCSGKTDKSKINYVDRGITVHEDFKENFETFYKEIGPRPIGDVIWSVGRIDNNSGYTYGNIRWETPEQQSRNKTKRVDNKTGVTGVSYYDGKFVAQCKLLNGKLKTKTFTVSKYGYEEAFELAVKARVDMIMELNKQGAGYSATHGGEK